MQKVITINLNGNAYQLDEDAFDALRGYLDNAETQLGDNLDRREIIADLEQAIAEKCLRYLGAHKTVVTAGEIRQIVQEMGPVDGGHAAGSAKEAASPGGSTPHADSGASATKRLYQIREGAMFSGVCNGIGAYLNIDPTIVRIAFVLLAIVTKGLWVVVYFALMFVIPYAKTSEEHAAAHGLPFTAQEMIDRAKQNYSEFKNKHWKDTKWQWRQRQGEWRRHMRAIFGEPFPAPPGAVPVPEHVGYAAQVLRGILLPVFGIAHAAITIAFLIALLTFLQSHSLWGLTLPPGVPWWVGIVILSLIYQVLVAPFRYSRHPSYYGYAAYGRGSLEVMSGVIWVAFTIFFFWLAYQYVPAVHDFMQQFPFWADRLQRV
jgi:phage shock protein PspC (stress-responsive transcriptional regulator)